jgi:hypothetical protein
LTRGGSRSGGVLSMVDNCSNCRFHSKQEQDRPIDKAGFDDVVEFADEPDILYFCQAPDEPFEVGLEPIHCDKWEPPKPVSPEVDKLMAKFEERIKK